MSSRPIPVIPGANRSTLPVGRAAIEQSADPLPCDREQDRFMLKLSSIGDLAAGENSRKDGLRA
jgi:hypothetical protein